MNNATKCFLIDDDTDDQEIFLTAIQDVTDGTECITSITADNALRMLRVMKHLPDYIFLDLNLPGMNGYEFLKEIKKETHLRSIPVIIYSTTGDLNDISKSRKLGASGFFKKPITYKSLCDMLRIFFSDGLTPGEFKTDGLKTHPV